MKYIAYGSNMSAEQMEYRCPGAKLLGTGYLPRAKLEFYLHATVEFTDDPDAKVPVAVWEIDDGHERALDRYEGHPFYYVKRWVDVRMRDGEKRTGMIYLMRQIRVAPPSDAYVSGIRNAYAALGFKGAIRTTLRPAVERAYRRAQTDAATGI